MTGNGTCLKLNIDITAHILAVFQKFLVPNHAQVVTAETGDLL